MQAALSTHVEAQLAGRATGAMFFAAFGAVWLEGWARSAQAGAGAAVGIVLAAALLLAAAWRQRRRYAPALAQLRDTPERHRAERIFRLVNSGQWILIVGLALVFANTGLGKWIVPMTIFVIGLHFVPLAHVFRNGPHYATGAALMALAVLYPLLARGGPTDPAGFAGAGAILWLSAAWALRPGRAPQHT
jgi:hypothetical protein